MYILVAEIYEFYKFFSHMVSQSYFCFCPTSEATERFESVVRFLCKLNSLLQLINIVYTSIHRLESFGKQP